MRIAIIYDNKLRPDCTGEHCKRSIRNKHAVTHFQPEQVRDIEAGYDLYLNIDDGLRYTLPLHLRPSAFWAIDTHFHYKWLLHKSRTFDHVFAVHKDGAEALRKDGIKSATWLPVACDPAFHRKLDVGKKYDVSFIGNVLPGGDTGLVEMAKKTFRSMFIDNRFAPDVRSLMNGFRVGQRGKLLRLVQETFDNVFVGNAYLEEMARIYSESRIVFNRSILNDVNMRVFEALSCGSMLVTNRLDRYGLPELFTDGVHLVTYANKREMVEKIRYYLAHDEDRERIAGAGMLEVRRLHTYDLRMERIITESLGSS
jgi:spore maturation protein CgeB